MDKTTKKFLLFIISTIIILGLMLLNWNNLSFVENGKAYVIIGTALVCYILLSFIGKKKWTDKARLIIFNSVLILSIFYILMEVFFNLSGASNIIRFLKILPASCLFIIGCIGKSQLRKKKEQ